MIYTQIPVEYNASIEPELIEKTVSLVFQHAAVTPEPDLSIVISDDAELQRLNQEFLGIDAPTDVLSFPGDEVDPETGDRYLGDIIISYARVKEQAAASGCDPQDELRLLVIHGVLHLLGHDHAEPVQKKVMWAAQREILDQIGIGFINPPE
jgi:probable rRNA maturation factor